MKILNRVSLMLFAGLSVSIFAACAAESEQCYVLFDGTSLDGWKASETPECFSITEDGTLKVGGGRSHLFWMGKAGIPASFTDFEFSAQVKTTAGSNSGLFFHTRYQETGWPSHGYEAQVNSTHDDSRKTGSIYAVSDVEGVAPSVDDVWFDYRVRVQGKRITVMVDGKVVNEYTEPDNLELSEHFKDRHLSCGTFAIQGHDPKSVVYFRDIKVRKLSATQQ